MARKDVTDGYISQDMTDANDNFIEIYDALDTKVALTGNETVAGVKTFSSSPVVPTPTTDYQASTKKYADDGLALKVATTGNETVAGIKTFSSFPLTPSSAPSTDYQVANKEYADTKVSLTGNETVAGVKTFSSFPVTPSSAPSTDYQTANKKYVDDEITDLSLGTASTKDTGTADGELVLKENIPEISNPAGTVIWHAADSAPTGYLKANGATISRTTYADLFAVIGTTFGSGDESTTFEIPDLRGEFIRGWDDSRGVDSGRAFGSSQSDEFESHVHRQNYTVVSTRGGGDGDWHSPGGATNNGANTDATGGAETRPRNIALLACIKY